MAKSVQLASAFAALLLATAPAQANVKAGVDAWSKGDYTNAVKSWRQPAIAGDADAQFNLGQAYKLGRGVPADLKMAQEWYGKAAAQGHLQAEDNYGLILFQNGDRQRALPIVEKSANRGEPRAQYIYGTALFNGDLITKDWPRAYAFMTRASSAGLGPASSSLAQMDKYIPLEQRQRGLAIARDLEARASRPQTTMNDSSSLPSIPAGPAIPSARYEPIPAPVMQSAPMPVEGASRHVRRSRQPDAVSKAPPVEIARAEQQMASGPSWRSGPSALPLPGRRTNRRPTEEKPVEPELLPAPAPFPAPEVSQYPQPVDPMQMPEDPGTSYPAPEAYPTYPSYPAPAPRVAPPVSRPAPTRAPSPVVRKPAPVATSGAYRVQLGAFSDQGRAKALWSSLSRNVSALNGMQPYLVRAGNITRLQAGPIGSKATAERVCGQVRSAGQSCLIVGN